MLPFSDTKIESFYHNVFLKYRKISTDSRNVVKDSIFFSLSGVSFDGNSYAAAAIANGAAFAIVDNPAFFVDNGNYLLVDNCLSFLQKLARLHRYYFKCPVIGITGTNGKTTTKELITGLLSLKYRTYSTQGNFNNHIGVPLSLLSVNENDAQFVVIEMGANHPDEIDQLCLISDPDYGIISSVGKAHLEGFGNFETIIETKTALYRYVSDKHGIVFVNADSDILMNKKPDSNVILYGSHSSSHYLNCYGIIDNKNVNVTFDWKYESKCSCHVDSAMYGQYNYINMLAAACVASYFDVDVLKINEFLSSYLPSNNRSQVIKKDNVTIISDAYNANPSSMSAALDSFDKIIADNKVAILGDMFELGVKSIQEHNAIIQRLSLMSLSQVILVGNTFSSLKSDYISFKSTIDASEYLKKSKFINTLILLKGSRGMKLETLIEVL